jgi:hypothetical protein
MHRSVFRIALLLATLGLAPTPAVARCDPGQSCIVIRAPRTPEQTAEDQRRQAERAAAQAAAREAERLRQVEIQRRTDTIAASMAASRRAEAERMAKMQMDAEAAMKRDGDRLRRECAALRQAGKGGCAISY